MRLGIRSSVLGLALLPATLIAIITNAYQTSARVQDLNRALSNRGQAIVNHLAPAAEFAVFSANTTLLNQLAHAVLKEPDVIVVTIQDADDKVLIRLAKPTVSRQVERLVFEAPIYRTEMEVSEAFIFSPPAVSTDSPRRLGRVWLALSQQATRQRQQEVIATSVALALLCLLVAGLLGWRIGRQITEPIFGLEATVRKLRRGQLEARIEERAAGELGHLEADVNAMADALEASHRHLEEQIAAATEGLREALASLEAKNSELDEARRKAEKASRVKSEFLANMSHEIRTPMNGFLGFMALLAKTPLSATQRSYLTPLKASADNLLTVINSILDFSKLEAGKLTLNQRPFQLHEVLEQAVFLFSPNADEKGLTLTLAIAPWLPRQLVGDAQRLTQVVTNLVSNAIKFTRQGDVVVQVRRVSEAVGSVKLCLSVCDTGIGIAPADQKILFTAFNQVDASTTRQQGGTGLGLAICRHLVTLMGGHIEVDSQPGRGTTFHVTLTLAVPTGNTRQTAVPRDAVEDPPGTPPRMAAVENSEVSRHQTPWLPLRDGVSPDAPRVLVVDDNPVNRTLAQVVLEDFQARVDEASQGQEAIAACRRTRYDLILMDIRMPGMDGFAATQAIRQLSDNANRDVPIIALTADVLHESGDKLLQAGMNDYLYKPLDAVALSAVFTRWCTGVEDPAQRTLP